jgi:hypothetical protein
MAAADDERGARTTAGYDWRPTAAGVATIVATHQIAATANLNIEYVHGDVYQAVAALGGRHFDVVYTGKEALRLPAGPRSVGRGGRRPSAHC